MNMNLIYYETRMPAGVLELIADVLIYSNISHDDLPVYTEQQMNRKLRQNHKSAEHVCFMASDDQSAIDLENIDDILHVADFNKIEKSVLMMHMRKFSQSEISKSLGIPIRTIKNHIRNALYKLNTMKNTEYGFDEVYNREVHKTIYIKPSHCGEQPCRRLGYCRYAHLRKPRI